MDERVSDPQLCYYIGQSENIYDDFGHYLHSHTKDPAMKVINISTDHHHHHSNM